ncbi:MAG: sn-glycerol-3-phosphate ABC transporter ATP-binding protein UgpC [Actinomycetota bacterium]
MAEVSFEQVSKRYGNGFLAVDELDLEVADGELLVVVGPSGCGKTTTLRMLAGLEEITSGRVRIGDRVVNDLSAKERDIAMVFQSYALYPHLSVADNLGYPLRMARMGKQERKERVVAVAKQLRLDELLDRKPRQLSGGQRQRVAMGRAMVREPQVFLMDEPLSNLDAKLRVIMRSEVAELQQHLGVTMFYVTHDQIEAMTMGHRVAIMNDGVLMQVAAPAELYRAPANLFVAGFIGSPPMNLFGGTVELGDDQAGAAVIRSGPVAVPVSGPVETTDDFRAFLRDRPIVAGVRPERVRLSAAASGAEGSGDIAAGTVRLVEMLGSESLVHVEVDGLDQYRADADAADATGTSRPRLLVKVPHDGTLPTVGEHVSIDVPWDALHLFDASSGDVVSAAALPAAATV